MAALYPGVTAKYIYIFIPYQGFSLLAQRTANIRNRLCCQCPSFLKACLRTKCLRRGTKVWVLNTAACINPLEVLAAPQNAQADYSDSFLGCSNISKFAMGSVDGDTVASFKDKASLHPFSSVLHGPQDEDFEGQPKHLFAKALLTRQQVSKKKKSQSSRSTVRPRRISKYNGDETRYSTLVLNCDFDAGARGQIISC